MPDAERLTDERVREIAEGGEVYIEPLAESDFGRGVGHENWPSKEAVALAREVLAARAGDREEWVTGEVPVMIDWCAECDDIATMECQVDHGSRTRPRRAMLSESQALNREPDTAPVTIVMEGNVVTPTEAAQAMLGSRAAPGGETRAEG